MPVKKETTVKKVTKTEKVTASAVIPSAVEGSVKETKPVAKAPAKSGGLSVTMFSLLGKEAGSLDLPKAVFGAEINRPLLAQAMRVYINNQKGHFSNTKTRGEVEGSTRKIYKQKGTGRARHGGIRAPIFVGGGIALGPKSRQALLELPKKMKKAALISALSQKHLDNDVFAVSGLEKATGKTSQLSKFLKTLGKKSILIVSEKNDLVTRATQNLKGINLISTDEVNAFEVIKAQSLIFTKGAVAALESRIMNQESRGESEKSGTEPRDTLGTLDTRGTSKKEVK
jgi:large subunit ribosomal protein L4